MKLCNTHFVYGLTAVIHSAIFNLNKFVTELDVDQVLANPPILPCNCDKSAFIDKDNDHILTRDLTK